MSIRALYKNVAEGNEAKFNSYSQSGLLSQLPLDSPSRKGICRAVCLYEAHFAKRGESKDFREEMQKNVHKASALQESQDIGNAVTVDEMLIALYQKQAPPLGLTYVGLSRFTLNWLQGAINYTTRNSYYVQMLFPNHVVSMRPGKDGSIIFFDPNYGQITCPKAELFHVLSNISSSEEFRTKYELTNDTDIILVFLA